MLSDLCVVLIQVNPAGTSTYGGRAQPSSYILMPYSGQIKGWDLRNKAAHTNMRSSKERSHTAPPQHDQVSIWLQLSGPRCVRNTTLVCVYRGERLQDAYTLVRAIAC